MKKISYMVFSTVIFIMIGTLYSCSSTSEEQAAAEEQESMRVLIGDQVWMTTNLDVDKFRNGDPILYAKTKEEWDNAGYEGKPAWCYYDDNPANGKKYGKLYNWYAVNDPRGLAPKGWHIPTDKEWTILSDFLGGADHAGIKMKSTDGWEGNGNGTNSSGFSGLPGGFRYDELDFTEVGFAGYWWSSTERDGTAWDRSLFNEWSGLDRDFNDIEDGLSVRCIKD